MYMYMYNYTLYVIKVYPPVVLQVPVQKLQALNGKEMEIPVRSVLLNLRVKVLQLQLVNAAPGFVYTCT